MSTHARLSPSSAFRWSVCTAAPSEEDGKPNPDSEASRSGTADHLISSICLETGKDPVEFLGREVAFWTHAESNTRGECFVEDVAPSHEVVATVEIDDEAVERCRTYINYVDQLVRLTGGMLLVEQSVPIDHITGEEGATGTSDAIVLAPDLRTIYVVDAKFGRGRVDACETIVAPEFDLFSGEQTSPGLVEPNRQMAMYASGALRHVEGMFAPGVFDRVEMTIVQPRLEHISTHNMPVADLHAFVQNVLAVGAQNTRTNPTYAPDADRCHFCRGKETCTAVRKLVLETALDGFGDLDAATPREVPDAEVGLVYEKLDLIEDWCAAQRERVRRMLERGQPVVGSKEPYKLIEGRKTPRRWKNPHEAEVLLRDKFRLKADAVYTRKLISPTKAETLTKTAAGEDKPAIGKRQWSALQELIVQDTGRPQIVPASHPKPALPTVAGDMPNLDTAEVSNPEQPKEVAAPADDQFANLFNA